MNKDSLLTLVAILSFLGSLSVVFGKDLPRSVRLISVASLILASFIASFSSAKSIVSGLFGGIVLSIVLNLLTMMVRRARTGHF